jgi:hypothetical protein
MKVASVFAPGKPFQPSLMFKLGWKGFSNTLAYYENT